ncbi:MAG: response regulator transcription factor [Pseudomonadota bacterium]
MLNENPPTGLRRFCALLVDAQEVMQIGVSHLLRTHHIDVVAACATCCDAVRLAQLHQPDLVVMETELPDGPSFDACRRIRAACPRAQVVFLTSRDCDTLRAQGMDAGAHGYLLKDVGARDLAGAIHAVLRRRLPIDIHAGLPALRRPASATEQATARPLLSPQECKIPPLVADGKTNKEIAGILGLSEKTVKNYLSNIYLKLQVSRRSQLAALFARHGN